jgi:hypothetical protein
MPDGDQQHHSATCGLRFWVNQKVTVSCEFDRGHIGIHRSGSYEWDTHLAVERLPTTSR